MGCTEGPSINSFALVSYIPDPLGGFLDRLRTDLVCDCHAKAHVTVLPPRPLFCETPEAWSSIQQRLREIQPFEIKLGEIEIFPVTDVIYLSIASGFEQLRELHASLDIGCLEFEEPFHYHPHVTLAQDLTNGQLAPAVKLATDRWHEFRDARTFTVDKLTFVQNTLDNHWKDLNALRLAEAPVPKSGRV